MAHLLQTRQSGAVAEAHISIDKGSYSFNVDVQKWDDKTSSPTKAGHRNFPLPSNLWPSYSIGHFKTQLGNALPPTTPGAEHGGQNVGDEKKLSELVTVTADSPQILYLVFNVDKSAASAPVPSAASSGGLQHGTSVRAGTGPITADRELAAELSIYADSGTNYLTVKATSAAQGLNYEGKWTVSDNYLTSTSIKELKSKLVPPFPKTSDRGTLKSGVGSKNIKDADKLGALGVKGKKGDTVKYNFSFEIASAGGAVASTAGGVPAAGVQFEPAPEIEAKWRYFVDLGISLMEGNVFLTFNGRSEENREGGALPEARKSAALPKVTFSVFLVRDLLNILKSGMWPTFQPGWCIVERAGGEKVKVGESVPLEKIGLLCPPSGTNNYKLILAIDPHHTLPTA